jgi:hypothetical protein
MDFEFVLNPLGADARKTAGERKAAAV